ncbi:hypothetical protein [Paraflavitalea sp. CAU 1676]|uniref:hypothetical protein n=1 Tax=Paraflavitalea sp. CAU 1676 TaxID=3032598 RepID=UPI0023DB741A|nr:hypothetical protein [Paraflavitalea sp. CAU 1676]MDF2192394.1 hypothetical protein [Paraflavitalea sp. CAU 1676]
MILHIHPERLISEIQQEFNDLFPFLKIELFAGEHGYQQPSPLERKLPRQLPMKFIARDIPAGDIELTDSMRVFELENIFHERFGINLQVFRRSGNLWLETTVTDSWTLKQQNEYGRELTEVKL